MARKMNVISDTFPALTTSGIVACRVVVMDSATRGNVKLPAATPEKTAAGVSLEKVDNGGFLSVQTDGVAIVESDGTAVINPGDYVVAGGGADGRIKSQAIAAGNANVYDIIGMCVDRAQIPATAGALASIKLWKRPTVAA